ncbi:FtsW/RodA/SpoVE family cell cycle protein [Actinomyces trachealis]|uniref:FtsW/RodA/SpoVE family cell cycle protein n=1 Tax=Actinomyces trachealis TaxID=2763540 RepID=UPI001892BA55|nr:FtsW/RodA/SpoVE family cell cycle protein [Actinomyces trachealis]
MSLVTGPGAISPDSRRRTEAKLLVVAVLVGLSGLVLTVAGRDDAAWSQITVQCVALVTMPLIAHLAIRFLAPHANPLLLPAATALNGLGVAMLRRLDFAFAYYDPKDKPQMGYGPTLHMVMGMVLMVLVLFLLKDSRRLERAIPRFWKRGQDGMAAQPLPITPAQLVGILAVPLLLLPFVPGIGLSANGARVWVNIAGFGFQPSELAKILLAIFFAYYLKTRGANLAQAGRRKIGAVPLPFGWRVPKSRDLVPLLIVWALATAFLVAQNDWGMSVMFFGMFVVTLCVSTGTFMWAFLASVLIIPMGWIGYLTTSQIASRFTAWIHAMDPQYAGGPSYQLVQGLFALAWGGTFGTGWGQGDPDLIPEVQTDFILAAFGEELGLTGTIVIILLYATIVMVGLRTALGARDNFGKLLATGLSFSLALQVFVMVGALTRLLPLTGLTTPLLSNGGSSVLSTWIILAILLRLSDTVMQPGTEDNPANRHAVILPTTRGVDA